MEYLEETETSSIPRTPDLELSVKDQYQLGALTFLEQDLTQVMETVGEKPISLAQETLTESLKTPGTDSEMESGQPSPTPVCLQL